MVVSKSESFGSQDFNLSDITKDDEFLRIRNLNGQKNNQRRSLHLDQVDGEEYIESSLPESQSVLIDTVDRGDAVIVKTSTSAKGDKRLHIYLKSLKGKEKGRYKKNGGEMQSMTRDLQWNSRGSIMDELVNYPLKMHFRGPAMDEKPLKFKQIGDCKVEVSEEKDSLAICQELMGTDFSGFYVLFWMAVAFLIGKVTMQYYDEHNGDFSQALVFRYMTNDLWRVGIYDTIMYASTYVVFGAQYLCRMNYIKWRHTGRTFVAIFETTFLFSNIYFTKKLLCFNWISQIFLFLHSLVLLMKMHSYSFYNGYLWDIKMELEYSKKTLKTLSKLKADSQDIEALQRSIDFCEFELHSQAGEKQFPDTITLSSFFEFSSFPTLVYEIKYPRTDKIRWSYVFEKLCAIFGIIFVMMVVAQSFMFPVVMEAKELGESGLEFKAKMARWLKLVIDLAPSFITMFLLVWYLIWDCILNCIAELTRFGDRHFYSDWWNCVTWYDFSRLWNRPVHSFLLRHVYHSSISAFNLNKTQAMWMTFMLSSLFHELAMYVLFGKLRWYIITFQMSQLPFTAISNHPLVREKKLLNNIAFWLGICLGPSMTGLLYLVF